MTTTKCPFYKTNISPYNRKINIISNWDTSSSAARHSLYIKTKTIKTYMNPKSSFHILKCLKPIHPEFKNNSFTTSKNNQNKTENDSSSNQINEEIVKKIKLVKKYIRYIIMGMWFLSTFIYAWLASPLPPKVISYSEFFKTLEAGNVESVYFENKSNKVHLKLKNNIFNEINQNEKFFYRGSLSPAKKLHRCITHVVPGQTQELVQTLKSKNVNFGVIPISTLATFINTIGTVLIMWLTVIPILYFMRRIILSQTSNRNTSSLNQNDIPNTKFSDVAGIDGVKQELRHVVKLLKNKPMSNSKLKFKLPSGILLSGPTGTGKTLLARAIAGEANVPFFSISASEFVELYVGQGASRVRQLFREAEKKKPCVIFVDEIDAVGGRRGNRNDERDQTLNQLLVELDGFQKHNDIIMLAATNRPNMLDSALMRPGRLTWKIEVPLPDYKDRIEILAVHMRDLPISDVSIENACINIAGMTHGFSGAELANIVNEASLLASRKEKDYLEYGDLLDGYWRTVRPINAHYNVPVWLRKLNQWVINKTNLDDSNRQLPTYDIC